MTDRRYTAEAQLALMTLTRIPAGHISGEAPSVGQAIWAFPLVGALLGAVCGTVFWTGDLIGLPPLANALLAIATSILLTGGLHEDGLADVADGFGGGTDKQRKLEIMRDSRVGSYGVLALVLVVGLTATGMAAVGAFGLFVAIGALSRTAMVVPLALLPPARPDGLGAAAAGATGAPVWAAVALTLPFLMLGVPVWSVVVPGVAVAGFTWLAKRQIGGQTGDVLGASQKISECTAWLAAAAACCAT